MIETITLIGMPGAGKSTIGRKIAGALSLAFIDSDDLITQQQQRSLQAIVDQDGYMQLRSFEEQAILSIDAEKAVISTGGSTVYSEPAMQHLQALSTIIYLSVPYPVIEDRIKDLDTRGLAKKTGQSLHDLYFERVALYERYAEITVAADAPVAIVADRIMAVVSGG